jgi:serine phosphatase RsbU (regulator of sigma subunit)
MRKFLKIGGIAFLVLIFFFLPFADALKLDAILISIYIIYKFFSFILKKILWKIRNKLILSYLFLTIIPLLLFLLLSYFAVNFFFARYGNYIVTNNLQYRLEFMKRVVDSRRDGKENFGIIKINDKKLLDRFNYLIKKTDKNKKKKSTSGMLIYQKTLNFYYYFEGSLFIKKITENTLESIRNFTLWKPTFLVLKKDLSKEAENFSGDKNIEIKIGESPDKQKDKRSLRDRTLYRVSCLEKPEEMKKNEEFFINLSKFQFMSILQLIDIDRKEIHPTYFTIEFDKDLAVKKIKTTVLSGTIDKSRKIFFYIMSVLVIFFSILYIISFILGIILAKSITSSISNLYEGTKKIIDKNFKFKIHKIPSDQLGEVALSFNSMADSINNLLEEEKEKERLKREIELAAKMQNRLLPKDDLKREGIILSGLSIFAQEVGGDYYDYFETSDGRLFFSIADVAGKGMTAAFYMAEVKGIVRSLAESSFDLGIITEKVNNIIFNSLEKISFVTAILGYIDKDRKKIRYVRCGHPLPIFVKKIGEISEIKSEGVALGLKEEISDSVEVKEIVLEEADTMIFYTDGLSEMTNDQGELFTSKGIVSLFKERDINSIRNIKKRLKDGIYSYITEDFLDDDITLLIIRKG